MLLDICNVCGIGDSKIMYRGGVFKGLVGLDNDYAQEICLCKNCGFIWVRNPLTKEQLDKKYKFFSAYEFDTNKTVVVSRNKRYLRRSFAQKYFIELSLQEKVWNSMLEIGASTGYNLSLYKDKDVFGIEPSKLNCYNAKMNYDVDMFCGTFDEYYTTHNHKLYDLIFLSHTLEHIVNPCTFMKKCSTMNSKYIFIEVPSLDYKLQQEPYGMFTDEHVNIFTFQSLQHLMNECGYSYINADISFDYNAVSPSAFPSLRSIWCKTDKIKKIKPIFSADRLFTEYLSWSELAFEKLKKRIDVLSNDANIALWGIGNTAARILGNTNLAMKRIVRCYDSDNRKHGFYFAGCPISSFACEDITNGIIDTIVITSCTAQNTLFNILEPFEDKIEIIKLFEI